MHEQRSTKYNGFVLIYFVFLNSPEFYDLTNNVLQGPFHGPAPPTEELMAAKRFALEAEMAGDLQKLNNLRVIWIENVHVRTEKK